MGDGALIYISAFSSVDLLAVLFYAVPSMGMGRYSYSYSSLSEHHLTSPHLTEVGSVGPSI
jgi:hypothetical protein